MASEGLPVQDACRVLEVSESGYFAWRSRSPSPRSLRHAWLTERIRQIHAASRGTYGARRVHAELTLGSGLVVWHGTVEMLMQREGIRGLPGSRRRRPVPQVPTAADLVDRDLPPGRPQQVMGHRHHRTPTREGKVYCCVVLDVYSRRVVGWSIDSTQTSTLVANALGMAIQNRAPQPGGLIHSGHGVQGGLNRSSQHLALGSVGWVGQLGGCRR
ncbi:IS3 family transposase [Actinomadura sp. NPDC048955]|uniref:IS3 family transposase n=1 Tax=Actinomadura sp. NPDC048955 TaxID=3158228 RepID=UPI003410BFB7